MTSDLTITLVECAVGEIVRIYCQSEGSTEYQYVYRTGTSVSWNSSLNCFESPYREKGFIEAFKRILIAVKLEVNVLLTLKSSTKYSGISPDTLIDLLFSFFDFQMEYFPSFDFVYIETDGSIREVTLDERIYLKTGYSGADGARPYIKSKYKDLDGNGRISGFCFRNKIPSDLPIRKHTSQFIRPNIFDQLENIAAMKYKVDFKELEYVEEIIRLTKFST